LSNFVTHFCVKSLVVTPVTDGAKPCWMLDAGSWILDDSTFHISHSTFRICIGPPGLIEASPDGTSLIMNFNQKPKTTNHQPPTTNHQPALSCIFDKMIEFISNMIDKDA